MNAQGAIEVVAGMGGPQALFGPSVLAMLVCALVGRSLLSELRPAWWASVATLVDMYLIVLLAVFGAVVVARFVALS